MNQPEYWLFMFSESWLKAKPSPGRKEPGGLGLWIWLSFFAAKISCLAREIGAPLWQPTRNGAELLAAFLNPSSKSTFSLIPSQIGTQNSLELLEDPKAEVVDEIAAKLGLRKVLRLFLSLREDLGSVLGTSGCAHGQAWSGTELPAAQGQMQTLHVLKPHLYLLGA